MSDNYTLHDFVAELMRDGPPKFSKRATEFLQNKPELTTKDILFALRAFPPDTP